MTQPKNRRIATEDYFDKATADFPRTVPVINKGQVTMLPPGSDPTFAVRRIGTTNVYEVDMGLVQGATGAAGGMPYNQTLAAGTNLNDVLLTGQYRALSSSGPDLALNYPIAASGTLNVSALTSTVVNHEYYPSNSVQNSRVRYQRYLTGSNNWTPWRAFVAQRIDKTAGIAIYTFDDVSNREQLIYGETGRRSVGNTGNNILVNGWSATGLVISRVGRQVSLEYMGISGANASSTDAMLMPPGFTPGNFQSLIAHSASGTNNLYASNGFYVRSDGRLIIPTNAPVLGGGGVYGKWTWDTYDAWPTNLPGSPLGNIPNL